MNASLGARVKALRAERNYTQEQVAEKLGISLQKYAHIENGASSITVNQLGN